MSAPELTPLEREAFERVSAVYTRLGTTRERLVEQTTAVVTTPVADVDVRLTLSNAYMHRGDGFRIPTGYPVADCQITIPYPSGERPKDWRVRFSIGVDPDGTAVLTRNPKGTKVDGASGWIHLSTHRGVWAKAYGVIRDEIVPVVGEWIMSDPARLLAVRRLTLLDYAERQAREVGFNERKIIREQREVDQHCAAALVISADGTYPEPLTVDVDNLEQP
jgi:hypothetical protein